ncbi:chaperone for protein-folding within the ER, fungal-domain-containing protein [Sphaerosporella brunnea]|uniref:Protein ROT1 n=1 Tax=Sphaerosporella brunnea TaxID=1250544 RepID=A0A5J5EGB6_9PEZI|nr:chaperone for protein-folding within the ER, fungal-domain-containing protein [Sphaerosporella brunnea]
MIPSIAVPSLLAAVLALATALNAQNPTAAPDPLLVGTWSSKSGTVVTGSDFYDYSTELLKEPRLPGSSYSFTADGHYEEALYIVVSNPTTPSCPSAVLQWQHGEYTRFENGSLVLNPIQIDGRQLLSEPCNYDTSIYTRYNQSETIKWYEIITDEQRGKKRLNLYKFDGAPMNPMYLEYTPPQMLPTTTLHPPKATNGGGAKIRRRAVDAAMHKAADVDADRLWWLGLGLTGVGLLGYYCV